MTATDTYMLLRAFCDELARCGVEHACTSPGSRSTPLVLSLVRDGRIRCHSHIDERCAGFFAVGAAKATARPTVVTCTSGTAAANLAPAVIEAHHARVPLIVLTADRPAELRDVGAGQTIDQDKLYGGAVKWFFEVGVHEATGERLRWIRALACRAYWTAVSGRPGAVHLNFPLREPLVPDGPLPDDETGREDGNPYVLFQAPRPAPAQGPGPHPSGRIVLVAGADPHDADGSRAEALAALAARAGIPLLADPLSGARRGPAAIAHYDLLLREPAFTERHRPDFVIRVGDLPTSKPLRAWLAGLTDMAQIAIDPDATWHDPAAVVGLRVVGELPRAENVEGEPGWLQSWREADAAAGEAIGTVIGDQLCEPFVAQALIAALPAQDTLFVASSMPVRDVEEFARPREDPPRVLSNRGANGIDGTVSAAYGAAVTRGRVTLLIGDVALLHDIGGLMAGRRLGIPLTIVLLNNDGGGIFHFLPVAGETDAFEEHVATPHGIDFASVAALYGADHVVPADAAGFAQAVANARESEGTTLIEVRTERAENLALHRRVAEAVREALSRPAPAAAPGA